jgi:release factor glutamine methyltransferase
MDIRSSLIMGQKALSQHECAGSEPALEAELLLGKAVGLSRETILATPDLILTTEQNQEYLRLLERRMRHEPAAYIVGSAACRGLEFEVDRSTLIPRPATESIIDAAANACYWHPDAVVIDVGTGCGCIAVSMARDVPEARFLAIDTSVAAIRVARRNAETHHVADRLDFRKGDLLSPIEKKDVNPDEPVVIVANLPYLPSASIAGLIPDIRLFEPLTALDGGQDGLDNYRQLIDQAVSLFPYKDLHVIVELLPEQFGPLTEYAEKAMPGVRTDKIMNLAGVCVGAAMRSACAIAPSLA